MPNEDRYEKGYKVTGSPSRRDYECMPVTDSFPSSIVLNRGHERV